MKSKKKVTSLFNNYLSDFSDCAYTRVLTAVYLFDFLDRIKASGFPSNWLDLLEIELNGFKKVSKTYTYLDTNCSFENFLPENSLESIECKTGEVYYNLWKDFSNEEYVQETYRLLEQRLARNSLQVESYTNALDDGCGSGRYTLALRKFGIHKVTGVDISQNSIDFAKSKNGFSEEEVSFMQGSVLDLPIEDNTFDFVFSNGVLHHTVNTLEGLKEIRRVLKPDGQCWLYLYGGKESFFWDVVEFCRELLKDIPQVYTQYIMKTLGYPMGRIFHRNDFWYVPINNRYFEAEVNEMLLEAGFSSFRRLHRGADHDWDEIIFNNKYIDPYIYGEGEMRYWIES